MALTRVSNDKWIDPDEVIAIERASNKQGYLLTLAAGGQPKFVSDTEFGKLVFGSEPYDSKIIRGYTQDGSGTVALDTAFKDSSFVDLTLYSGTTPSTLNLSSVVAGTHHQLAYWSGLDLTITNDNTSSACLVRHKNVTTSVASGNSFRLVSSYITDDGTVVFYRINNVLYIVNPDITIIFN